MSPKDKTCLKEKEQEKPSIPLEIQDAGVRGFLHLPGLPLQVAPSWRPAGKELLIKGRIPIFLDSQPTDHQRSSGSHCSFLKSWPSNDLMTLLTDAFSKNTDAADISLETVTVTSQLS